MKRHISAMIAFLGTLALALNLIAGDDAKPKPATQEVRLSGTLTQKIHKRKDKQTGEEKEIVRYVLVDAAGGTINIPEPKGKGADAINLADFIDQQVTIVGQGRTVAKKNKKGEEITQTIVSKVTAVEAGGVAPVGNDMDDFGDDDLGGNDMME